MPLLNKIPVLDSGYVALISASNPDIKLKELKQEYLPNAQNLSKLRKLSSMTLVVKCPIFVQVNLSQFDLNIVHTTNSGTVEAYRPNTGAIGGPDLQTNGLIADDIYRTTEALLINPRAYMADGCDKFISHLIMPISTYTTILVNGSEREWRTFCDQHNLPTPIEAYRVAIEQIYKAEWQFL